MLFRSDLQNAQRSDHTQDARAALDKRTGGVCADDAANGTPRGPMAGAWRRVRLSAAMLVLCELSACASDPGADPGETPSAETASAGTRASGGGGAGSIATARGPSGAAGASGGGAGAPARDGSAAAGRVGGSAGTTGTGNSAGTPAAGSGNGAGASAAAAAGSGAAGSSAGASAAAGTGGSSGAAAGRGGTTSAAGSGTEGATTGQTPVFRIPLRVHTALSDLTEAELEPILQEMNEIWLAQAGICFEIEVTASEENREDGFDFRYTSGEIPIARGSNGVYQNAHSIWSIDHPRLSDVAMPVTHPTARTTAHELGHALGLAHENPPPSNDCSRPCHCVELGDDCDEYLMRSGSKGFFISKPEIDTARGRAPRVALDEQGPTQCAEPVFMP